MVQGPVNALKLRRYVFISNFHHNIDNTSNAYYSSITLYFNWRLVLILIWRSGDINTHTHTTTQSISLVIVGNTFLSWKPSSDLLTMGGGASASALSSEDFVTMSQNLKEEYELLISSGYTDEEIRTKLMEKYHELFVESTPSDVARSGDGTEASTMITSEGTFSMTLYNFFQ